MYLQCHETMVEKRAAVAVGGDFSFPVSCLEVFLPQSRIQGNFLRMTVLKSSAWSWCLELRFFSLSLVFNVFMVREIHYSFAWFSEVIVARNGQVQVIEQHLLRWVTWFSWLLLTFSILWLWLLKIFGANGSFLLHSSPISYIELSLVQFFAPEIYFQCL